MAHHGRVSVIKTPTIYNWPNLLLGKLDFTLLPDEYTLVQIQSFREKKAHHQNDCPFVLESILRRTDSECRLQNQMIFRNPSLLECILHQLISKAHKRKQLLEECLLQSHLLCQQTVLYGVPRSLPYLLSILIV